MQRSGSNFFLPAENIIPAIPATMTKTARLELGILRGPLLDGFFCKTRYFLLAGAGWI
jgi:hypothetical protein